MVKKFLLALAASLLLASPALAQSACSSIYTGAVLTAGQWNACFTAKNDALGYAPVSRTGDTMTGPLLLPPAGVYGGLNLSVGSAPSTGRSGDFWLTTSGFNFQVNSQKYGPFNTPFFTGTAAPSSPLVYSFWSNTSAATIPVNIYDGAQWVSIGTLNPTTHTWVAAGAGGNAFFAVAGPASTIKTYTFPNTSSNVFTDTSASFTSAQLSGALTDESGSGSAVFATSAVINPTSVGATTPGTGKFTTLQVTSTTTIAVTGSTQCLQANTSGVVSGTGGACGLQTGPAWRYTSPSQSVSTSTRTTININTSTYDTASICNTTTHLCTPTTSGYYLVGCTVRMNATNGPISGGDIAAAYLMKNGNAGTIADQNEYVAQTSLAGVAVNGWVTVTGIVQVNGTTDTLSCSGYADSATSPAIVNGSFWGAFIHG